MQRVRVSAPRRPTEDPERVKRALANLFPDLRMEEREGEIAGETESLERLRELIRTQKIRDAARSQLLAGRRGHRTAFSLNKQAAYAGRVNFAAASALGDITVEIESDDLGAAIDYVAESTAETKR